MKILQIVPYFYPTWSYGGTPRVVYELSKALVRKGHNVTVFTTDAYSRETRLGPAGRRQVDGIEVFYFRNMSNRLACGQKIFVPFSMHTLIRRGIRDFDIIHLHEFRTLQNIAAYFYAKRYNVPYVLSAHGSVLRIMGRKRSKKVFDKLVGFRILSDARKLIAVSKSEVEQYRQMGVSDDRISVIPNWINVAEFDRLPAYGGFREKFRLLEKKVVLFLGRINKIKGLDFLVEAFAGIVNERDDVVLVIAGSDDGYERKLRSKTHGLDVIFTGLLTGDDKLSALVDADVLVYPSVFEVFGLVPFEALMSNTPVIVTDACGCGEIIREAKAGYLVKYGDVAGLRDRIIDVLDNPEKSKRMLDSGKEYIYNNLSWDEIAGEMVQVYEKTAGSIGPESCGDGLCSGGEP